MSELTRAQEMDTKQFEHVLGIASSYATESGAKMQARQDIMAHDAARREREAAVWRAARDLSIYDESMVTSFAELCEANATECESQAQEGESK